MHQPVYPLVHHNLLQTLEVQDVGKHKGTLGELLVPRLDDVGEDDALLTVHLPQLPGEPSAELAEAACDEDAGRLLCRRRGQRPGGGQELTLKYSYFSTRHAACAM